MPQYGDPSYWNKRYTQYAGSTFDWLETYASLKSLLINYLKADSKILILGCGNALFSEEMYDDGFKN
jgi:ubiquinone/menaquinone biosynthesis C-methylase UbiE